MPIKDIKYNGFTASPSDYECPDGDLAGVINLVPEDGALRPIAPPKELFELPQAFRVIFIHNNASFKHKHYIVLNEDDNKLLWFEDGTYTLDDFEGPDTPLKEILALAGSKFFSLNAVGNTLEALTDKGMEYLLWKNDTGDYLHLGNHIPELPITFKLSPLRYETSDPHEVEFTSYAGDDFTSETYHRLSEAIFAAAAQTLGAARENHRFFFPFFVRYAFRLYDGSHTMQSAPCLMYIAGINPEIDMGWTEVGRQGDASANGPAKVVAKLKEYRLCYSAHPKGLQLLKNWKDIVSGVDFFISEQFYNYDPNGKPRPFANQILPEKDLNEQIAACANFYLLKRLSLDEIYDDEIYISPAFTNGSSPTHDQRQYLTPDFNLSNDIIVTRERLEDDYDSHDTLIPQFSHAFNARLNIAGLKKKVFNGFRPDAFFYRIYDASPYAKSVTASITTVVKRDAREIAVQSAQATIQLDDDNTLLWFYYPDPMADRIYFTTPDGTQMLQLKPHDTLNGAYYLGLRDGAASTDATAPEPSSDEERIIPLPNKIYTSEVNNPFLFPLLGINTVGTGSILGISAAAKALSQGQFGQFPLYAFTTDGVWALEVTSSGTYSAIQPITRDVCINKDSITQLDDSVLFVTDRGIMMLSGSTSQCISEVLDSRRQPFNPAALPKGNELLNFAGFGNGEFNYLPFREFVAGGDMIYDYNNQRIIVYNHSCRYAYVFSLGTKQWGMMQSDIYRGVNSYPDALAMSNDYKLLDISAVNTDATTGVQGMLFTRPFKMDAPDMLKTIDTIIQRGFFDYHNGDGIKKVQQVLYGSRDLFNWQRVWSSTDHYLRGFRGTPFKYFRLALITNLNKDETLYGFTVQYTPRFTNQPR